MDLRRCINLISDVVNNRPMPLREFDQIYMKHADMILQIEHIGKWFTNKKVVFIGDGDAIALGLAYLQARKEIECAVEHITVLDFDERIVNSINIFAARQNISDLVSAKLYNVADSIPPELWRAFDCFYCNPPYGSRNQGSSIISFMRRGFEATGDDSLGCVVLADSPAKEWTRDALFHTQEFALKNGFIISEMIPRFHSYHLDDDPDLRSCSIVLHRITCGQEQYSSKPLDIGDMVGFYGTNKPLKYKYVKDLTNRQSSAPDYELVPFEPQEGVR